MRTLRYGGAVSAMGLIVLACAGNTGTAARNRCALSAKDSVYLAGGPVYRECGVDVSAKLLGTPPRPDFQPAVDRNTTRVCLEAEVEFVVDAQGVPEARTARVTRASDPRFGEALLATVPQTRYQPAQKDGAAVRQIVLRKIALGMALAQQGAPRRDPC